jgi:hypothetical protein
MLTDPANLLGSADDNPKGGWSMLPHKGVPESGHSGTQGQALVKMGKSVKLKGQEFPCTPWLSLDWCLRLGKGTSQGMIHWPFFPFVCLMTYHSCPHRGMQTCGPAWIGGFHKNSLFIKELL